MKRTSSDYALVIQPTKTVKAIGRNKNGRVIRSIIQFSDIAVFQESFRFFVGTRAILRGREREREGEKEIRRERLRSLK